VLIDGWQIEGSHDGYTHLPGSPRHRRRWRLEPDCLQIDDWLDPPTALPAQAWLHLAPGLVLEPLDSASWRVTDGGVERVRVHVLAGHARSLTTQHALAFGNLVDASTLALQLEGGRAALRLAWTL
jgi:hypothetical protein